MLKKVDFDNFNKKIGSIEYQIISINNKINNLKNHFNLHKKDNHSKRGMFLDISKKNRLLKYLKKNNLLNYNRLLNILESKKSV